MEWLQLLVPIPAFVLLLVSLVPFTILQPLVDPTPGGGMLLFAITLAAFLWASWRGVFGPDRATPNGDATAILDLRLAFATRLAIHLFFLVALVGMGLASTEPMILVIALLLLAAELPLAVLTRRRHERTAQRSADTAPSPA
jgi:hypothetical protein